MQAGPPSNRPRIYYGWYIVAAIGTLSVVLANMVGANIGVFITPMGDDLGTGRSIFGWAFTARMVGFGMSGLVIGRLLDRFGPRGPLFVAGLVFGAATVALGFISSAWQMLPLFALMGLLGVQAGQSLYTNVPVAQWFVRKRGRAMALAFVGVPIGIAISGPLSQAAIDMVGWRTAWVVLGIGGGSAIALISLLVLRRRPEDLDLLPDGVTPEEAAATAAERNARPQAVTDEHSWTRSEALRSGAFWRVAVVFGLLMFGTSTMNVFRIPYFVDQGVSPQLAAYNLTADAITAVFGSLIIGYLLERVQPRLLVAMGFCFLIVSFLLTMAATNLWGMFISSAFIGAGLSTLMVSQNAIWPAYFGRAHLGSIRGIAMPVTLACSATGAPLAGMVHDATGSYFSVWWVAIGAFVIAAIIMLRTPRPRFREADPDQVPSPQEGRAIATPSV